MGQQTVDSKSSDYGQANTKSAVPKHDKQLLLQVGMMGAALQDSLSESTVPNSKSMENPVVLQANNIGNEVSDVIGTKRPTPEYLVNPVNRCSTNNSGSGHLVYVRRRPEGEVSKAAVAKTQSSCTDYPQLEKPSQCNEISQTELLMKEARYNVPEVSTIPQTSERCSLSKKPSIPSPTEQFNSNLGSINVSKHQVTSTNPVLDNHKKVKFKPWEERYFQLQNLMNKLEQSKQAEYVQMLRSLSSVDLSKHAVELEKRSIRLALEEAKEVQRVRVLDVLGKYPKNPRAL